jgi:ubiquinone/menaquinone biosynthesis C-methylase UbiE
MQSHLAKGGQEGAAAAVVVAFYGEKFCMVGSAGGWEFPGGRVEQGESPDEAGKREMDEETGHLPKSLRFVCRGGRGAECALFTCELDELPTGGTLFGGLPKKLRYGRLEAAEFLAAAWRARTDYERVSQYFDSVRGTAASSTDAWLDLAHDALGGPSGKVLADIGCGSGRYSIGFAGKGCKVVGVDASGGMLRAAASKCAGGDVLWVRGDGQRLPLSGGSADATLVFLALHHMPLWRDAISECARILRPGGRLLIVTTARDRLRKHTIRHFPGALEIDMGRFQSIAEIRGAMKRSGFISVSHSRHTVDRGLVPADAMVERFARKYISTLALIPEREFPARLATFEGRLRTCHGGFVPDDTELCYIVGQLPGQKTI